MTGDAAHDGLADLVRAMALVDENIGLRAELAELRHRTEVAGLVELAPDAGDPAAELDAALSRAEAAEARAAAAEARLAEVLASRSWAIGQSVVALARLGRTPSSGTPPRTTGH